MNNIIILSPPDEYNFYSWQIMSIKESLLKLNLRYTIGLVERTINNIISDIDMSTIDLILILSCDHAYNNSIFGVPDKIENINNIPMIYVSHTNFYLSNCPVINYSIWFTIPLQDPNLKIKDINENYQKKYIFSCLNHHINNYRILNLIYLFKNNLELCTLLTFKSLNECSNIDFILNHIKVNHLDEYNYFYNNILNKLPIVNNDVVPYLNMISKTDVLFDYSNSAHTNCYVSIITESDEFSNYISEKTVKCLLAGQFFVIVSGQNVIKHLKELGFDTYDDIIDHSYDNESYLIDRLDKTYLELNRLQHLDWPTIYLETKHRRMYNRQKVLDMHIEKNFLDTLQEYIKLSLG